MKFLLLLLVMSLVSPTLACENLFRNDSLEDWYIVGPQIGFTLKDGVLTEEGKERRN